MKKAPKKAVKAQAPVAPGGNTWAIQEKALKELERGVSLLHKQSFAEALPHFQAILEGFPQEKELVDRVQSYARICKTQIDKARPANAKPEDYFYLGVIRANEANYAEAVEFLDRALQVNPRDEKAHYVMASTRSMRGEREPAIKHLTEAITLNATNRYYAQNDPDFEPLRGDDDF
ncbi:MAG TPA: tetratricopeptide repeat protein, partial [Candidatus Polarisedimenticolia bacterium]|nr:tetratricopeptide repeat protein [Candidatus Polarisedimenticolia bacterium]